MLAPVASDYVDRRFKGTKVRCLAFLQLGAAVVLRPAPKTQRSSYADFRRPSHPSLTSPPPTHPTQEDYFARLASSATLYIGNLSFYTTEDQVYALFSRVGHVQRVIMGLDSQRKTPCGFCFVVYDRREVGAWGAWGVGGLG